MTISTHTAVLPLASLIEILSGQQDYLFFAFVCLATLTGITLWLRRSGKRSDRTLIIGWAFTLIILIGGWFLVRAIGEEERARLRNRIEGLAPTYAYELTLMGHVSISLDTPSDDPLYLTMIEKQKQWLHLNRSVADIYTFRKHTDPTQGNQLIVDSETDYNHDGVYEDPRETRTDIGESWPEQSEQLENAYAGTPDFEDEPYTDRWGTWVSAYEPMLDENGMVEAVLGVDYPADDWVYEIGLARRGTIGLLALVLTVGLSSTAIIAVLRSSLAERRGSEIALRKARDAAEEATKAKSEFLANMSHEIRTPMNGIIGMTDLLLGTKLSPQQREYQDVVKNSAQSLLAILNDILDFSKIEARKLTLEERDFNVRDIIGNTLQTLGFRAGAKGLDLAYSIEPEVPEIIVGDAGRLRQILVNLASNAIKFTEEGEILVKVRSETSADENIILHVTVKDTGIGIPLNKQEAIFESFTQADNATTRNYGGTGLGLAISSQLVHLMHGNITVNSEPGNGSEFHFTAAFKPSRTTQPPTLVPPEIIKGSHILIADDNATTRDTLSQTVAAWGMIPVVAASGSETLEELKSAADSDRHFDFALIEIMLPDMNGPDLAEQMRLLAKESSPAIIFLSAPGYPGESTQFRRVQSEFLLAKPIKPRDLLRTITKAISAPTPALSVSAPTNPSPPEQPNQHPSLNILLAEDSHVNQLVASRILEDRGHKVTLVNDGKEALNALESESFDAVLMDLQMPGLDGYGATMAIRDREKRASAGRIPIIAMTANAVTGDREKCLHAGMDGYLTKPVQANQLIQSIEDAAQSGTKNSPGASPAKGPSSRQASPVAASNTQEDTFNPEAFKKRHVSQDLMADLIDIFDEEYERLLGEIESAAQKGDTTALHHAAHSLKGMLGNYASNTSLAHAGEVTNLARSGNLEGARRLLPALRESTKSLQVALAKFRAEQLP